MERLKDYYELVTDEDGAEIRCRAGSCVGRSFIRYELNWDERIDSRATNPIRVGTFNEFLEAIDKHEKNTHKGT